MEPGSDILIVPLDFDSRAIPNMLIAAVVFVALDKIQALDELSTTAFIIVIVVPVDK